MNWGIDPSRPKTAPSGRQPETSGPRAPIPPHSGGAPRQAATRRHLPARSAPGSRSRARRAPNAPPRSARGPEAGPARTPRPAAPSTTATRSLPPGPAPNAPPWFHRTPQRAGSGRANLVGGASRGAGLRGARPSGPEPSRCSPFLSG